MLFLSTLFSTHEQAIKDLFIMFLKEEHKYVVMAEKNRQMEDKGAIFANLNQIYDIFRCEISIIDESITFEIEGCVYTPEQCLKYMEGSIQQISNPPSQEK